MNLNLWGPGGPPAPFTRDSKASPVPPWLGGSGSLFSMSVQPNFSTQFNQIATFDFSPGVDVSNLSSLVIEPAFDVGNILEGDYWIAPFALEVQVTPIVVITAIVKDEAGNPIPGAQVNLQSTTVSVFGTTDSTGTVVFTRDQFGAFLLADIYNIVVFLRLSTSVPGQTIITRQTITSDTIISFTFVRPTACFTVSPSTTLLPGQTGTFDASCSADPDGTVLQALWNFGDGSPPVLQTTTPFKVNHAFTDPSGAPLTGFFTVTLTVTDDAGQTGTVSHTILVAGTLRVKPTDEVGSNLTGLPVQLFSGTTLLATVAAGLDGFAVFPGVLPGNYTATATLALSGAPGITKSISIVMPAGNLDASIVWFHPVASFTAPLSADPGFPASFDGSASNPVEAGGFFQITWSFGDGSSITGGLNLKVSHTYTSGPTTVLVLLSVANQAGLGNVTAINFPVNSPLSALISTTGPLTVGSPISFSSGASGGSGGYTYLWNFGDGTTSTLATPTHAYTAPGTYTVSLKLTDSLGNSVLVSTTLTVISVSFDSRVVINGLLRPTTTTLNMSGVLKLMGDVNADAIVNILDLSIVGLVFGATVGTPRYEIEADLNQDGIINILDLTAVSLRFGRTVAPSFLNGQTIVVEVFRSTTGTWVSVATPTTAPGPDTIIGQTVTAQGVWAVSNITIPSDATKARARFLGNTSLQASQSPEFAI